MHMKKRFWFLAMSVLGLLVIPLGFLSATAPLSPEQSPAGYYDDDRYDREDLLEDQYEMAYYEQQLRNLQQQSANALQSGTSSVSTDQSTTALTGLTEAVTAAAQRVDTYGAGDCELNGRPVPCQELLNMAGEVIPGGLGGLVKMGLIVLLIGGILALIWFIFWVWMLVDAIKYQKEWRVAWILIIVFFNVLGAFVYLFAAKMGRKKESEE